MSAPILHTPPTAKPRRSRQQGLRGRAASILVVGILVAAAVGLLAAAAAVASAATTPCGTSGVFSESGARSTCTYTAQGTEDTFTVPGGISAVSVTAAGAPGGASHSGISGGPGALVSNAALPVSPGQTWTTVLDGIGLPGLSITFE